MPQRASVTVSPSSSRMSRSTPCVEGCCGPMLTTTRSSASSATLCAIWSQSWPVTVKTRPSEVSLVPAKMDALRDLVPVLAGDREDAAL